MINISLADTCGKKIAKPRLHSFQSEIVKCGNGCLTPCKTLKLGVASKIIMQETDFCCVHLSLVSDSTAHLVHHCSLLNKTCVLDLCARLIVFLILKWCS